MRSKCLPRVISVPFGILLLVSALFAADQEKTIYEQAAVQVQGGHPEVAVALLQPWLDAHPDDVKALTLLGMALARDGKGVNANEYFGRALRIRPSYPPALKGLATSELALKQYAAAREPVERLLTVSPGDFVAHAGLAQIAFASQDFSNAARHFQESDSLARKVPRLLLEYARSEIALKEDGKARTLLNEMPDGADAEAHFD